MTTQEKVTISLPKELVNTLRELIPDRKRSKFIADLLKKQFRLIKKTIQKTKRTNFNKSI